MYNTQRMPKAVTVGPAQWHPNVRGWKVEELLLGEQIHSAYANGRLVEPAWYQVLREQGILRWTRSENPPSEITFLMGVPGGELPPWWKKAQHRAASGLAPKLSR